MKKVAIVMAAAMVATVLSVLGAGGVGAAQTCTGPGTSETPPASPSDVATADFDGDGIADTLYLTGDGANTIHALAVLSNGFTTSIDLFSSFAPQGAAELAVAVHDVDQDGDDEVFVNPRDFAQGGTLDLLIFAGCELVDGSAVPDGPTLKITGTGGGQQAGVDCLAPSAAGRGITQYTSQVVMAGQSQNHQREEWRLRVNDTTGALTWTRTLNHLFVGDQFADPTVTDTFPANQEAYRYERFPFSCPAPATCWGRAVTIFGTPFDDTVVGTGKRDVVKSGAGHDRISTKGGRDAVCAGGGNDTVRAGGGNDRVRGGGGKDLLKGQRGNDRLFGQGGNDTINGGGGTDFASGGKGTDVCRKAETQRSC